MKIFLKILNRFFVVLGIIFFIIILGMAYLFVADPFNLKPLFSSFNITPSTVIDVAGLINNTQNTTSPTSDTKTNSLISAQQEQILKAIGVNPDTLPTEITPALEKCLLEKVGAQRAEEIAKGADITTMDFLKASACFK